MPSGRSARAALAAAAIASIAAMAAAGNAPAHPAAAERAGAPAQAQKEAIYHLKPGATGKICLDCHADLEEAVRKPFVHTPVRGGQCVSCHSPHAAGHGKLLAASKEAICATCHETIVPEGAASAHPPAAEGRCVECHDPHASPNKANLLRSGNDLCLGCHGEMKAAIGAATHRHVPVERDCLGCHDPHASRENPSLLRKAPPALCLDCHKTDRPAFTQAHMGHPVSNADCTSCHDPHGSGNRALLLATVHPPVANRMCAQCHGDPVDGRMTMKRSGAELCRGCHSDLLSEIDAKKRVHVPVKDAKACRNCHEPHASKTPSLLAAPQKALCGGCHGDTIARQARSATKHPPVDEGECSTCHQPHGSDATFLFAYDDDKEVCGMCHDWSGHTAHPLGDAAKDQRNPNLRVSCLSCHRNHGTAFKFFTHADVKGDLCMQCHTQITR